MNLRTILAAAVLAVTATACSGALGVSPGDAVVPPESSAPTLSIIVLAADDLVAIDSTVVADGVVVPSDAQGVPVITWEGNPVTIDVEAAGFEPWTFTVDQYPEAGRIEFRLEPVVLQGIVTTDRGRPLPGATVTLGGTSDTTDNEGRYALARAVPGTIDVMRPAWEPAQFAWDGSVSQYDLSMEPTVVRALRVAPEDILEGEPWQTILSLADISAVNGVAIDVKTEDGTVVYATEVEVANAIGAVSSLFDVRQVVAEAREHDLYLIARIGVFQDDFYAAEFPDAAVVTETGALWRSANGYAWLDPSDPSSYDYAISLAEEACRLGFDEIQFDHVSYPFGGSIKTAIFDQTYNQEVRVASIAAFLDRAYSVLHPMRCTVSTTVLAITLESDADEGVGQRPGTLSRIVDVIAPTLYTTNYGAGWKGFADPNDHAVEIVEGAMLGGNGKLEGHGYLRPWLQTWTISTADQRAVQSIVTDGGMGWQLWSNNANYSADALPPR